MKHLAWHKGIEICRTGAGHIVVVDPRETRRGRITIVLLLAAALSLDDLFFPSVDEARESIDACIAVCMTDGFTT
jgi:hypothetical protein